MPTQYILYTLTLLPFLLTGCLGGDKSKAGYSKNTAKMIIENKTEHSLYQLYMKESNTSSYSDDMIPDVDYISATSKSPFETAICGKKVDIKVTGRFGDPKWYFEDQDLPCNKASTFTVTY